MYRRAVLAGLAVVATGCAARSGGDGGDGSPTRTPLPSEAHTTSTDAATDVTEQSFERTGDCEAAGSAAVTFDDDRVTVTGCIQGRNGCMQAALGGTDLTDGVLSIVVTTEKEGGDVCSQQIVQRGYDATFVFEAALPAEVRVVHESMDGRREVAQASN